MKKGSTWELMERPWRVCAVVYAMACTIIAMWGHGHCLNQEGQLLLQWKQNWLDDPDNGFSDWNASDATPCSWNGVACTLGSVSVLDFSIVPDLAGPVDALSFAKFANLSTLNLGNTSLNGAFPRDIVNCSKLVYLNLSNTYIIGKLPNDIVNLKHLEVLDLTYASMDGKVLINFGMLQELQVLRLAGNYFEGEMPLSVLSLTKLRELTLSENNWNGTLSMEFFKFPNLTALWLGSNLEVFNIASWPNLSTWENMKELKFIGVNFPPSLFPRGILKMTNLKVLHLERCNIKGSIPLELGNLGQLEELNLGKNILTGPIPDVFANMSNLRDMWVFDNQLSGPLPTSLWQCQKLRTLIIFLNKLGGSLKEVAGGVLNLKSSLTWLALDGNNLTGEIPSELGDLTLLTHFFLSNNSLIGTIPSSFENLKFLEKLWLNNNYLSGEILPSLGNLSLLQSLGLGQNNLTGKIPYELSNLGGLTEIYLYDNQLTGEIPYDLGKNTFLTVVEFSSNQLEGPIPPYLCWGNNKTLQDLKLNGNKLEGTIPETYGNCTSLVAVRFDGNYLEGHVPTGLWGGSNLVRMQLNGNNFSGSVPPNIGNARLLSNLAIHDNNFSGPLPYEIGQTSLVKFQANSNKFNGSLTPSLGNLSNLMHLTLGANALSSTIPPSLGNCTKLVLLDLSRNYFDGSISSELVNLIGLSSLDLSENKLSGTIPGGLFHLTTLKELNVAFNNLSGIIPHQAYGLSFVTINYTGNPYLCMENLCRETQSSGNDLTFKREKVQVWIIVVGIVSAMVVVTFVMIALIFRQGRKVIDKLTSLSEDNVPWTLTIFHHKVYNKTEITNLDEENIIGTGGSGKVYKVTLSDGNVVAVKKLWSAKEDEELFDHGFGMELKTLASIRHQNIVRLLCSCTRGRSNLLVYEYMPNGSLGDILHGVDKDALPWNIRFKIAMGAAKGLQYLHDNCLPQIIHRDIKPNNILLDLEYEAYLADFGIAKMLEPTTSYKSSLVVGSLGYMPPEYANGTPATEKVDVYSFGVVLLELVTGKYAPLECVNECDLVQWTQKQKLTQEGLYEILDPTCRQGCKLEMIEVLKIAMSCTKYIPASRPSMREVVKWLGDIVPMSSVEIDVEKD